MGEGKQQFICHRLLTFWQQCSLAISWGIRSFGSGGASIFRKHCQKPSRINGAPQSTSRASTISCKTLLVRSTRSHVGWHSCLFDSRQQGRSALEYKKRFKNLLTYCCYIICISCKNCYISSFVISYNDISYNRKTHNIKKLHKEDKRYRSDSWFNVTYI